MCISKAVINFKFSVPCSTCNVSFTCAVHNFRSIFVQVAGKMHVSSSFCRIFRTYRNRNICRTCSSCKNLFTVDGLCHPALNPKTVCRIYQSSVNINSKSSCTGVKRFFTVFQDKKAVSLNCKISCNTRCLKVSLSKHCIN